MHSENYDTADYCLTCPKNAKEGEYHKSWFDGVDYVFQNGEWTVSPFQFTMGGSGGLEWIGSPIKGVKSAWADLKALFKGGAKGGVQITKHAAERGITQRMVETGISKGTKYFDPKNGSYNYVLKNGFASGKDLLIGISPQTGKVITVIRGKNLVNSRFILQ